MVAWPDIAGVTVLSGRARLPRVPGAAAVLLREVCRPGATVVGAVEAATRQAGEERARLEGLAGWLPLSRVVRVEPDGRLRLHPETSPADLALRYAAWVGSQPVQADQAAALQAYAARVAELLAQVNERVGRRDELPWETPGGEADAPLAPLPPITARLRDVLDAFGAAFVEREAVLRMAMLALLAGRHVLLLGPPGTAKSLLARALCGVVEGGVYFEYLLSRFTHPDELFGPVSIPGLKEEDYRRLTRGFLPEAHVAFLDEIFKANSAILNSLLTLINERTFHHGRHRDAVPLRCLVGASNELPDPEGGLSALYDRFLVRLGVPPVEEPRSFLAVATGALAPSPSFTPITLDELDALTAAAGAVDVPAEVQAALVGLWELAKAQSWGVSDRRWRHAVDLLRTAAAAEGRAQVELLDLLLLEHVLAPEPGVAASVREALVERVAPRAVPQHDLRALWALLHLDRVPPLGDGPLDDRRPPDFDGQLELRRRHADRFIAHAEAAVAMLARDRDRLERRDAGRLWIERLPSRVLASHLEAARDLARVLEVAEAYRASLDGPRGVGGVLLASLPGPARRDFAAGVAVRLVLEDLGVDVGVSLSGERVDPPEPVADAGTGPHLSRVGRRRADFELDVFERAPRLVMSGAELIALARGELSAETLLERAPVWARRNIAAALSKVVERLGPTGVPRPPELPAPEGI